jgi:hypothetical protein
MDDDIDAGGADPLDDSVLPDAEDAKIPDLPEGFQPEIPTTSRGIPRPANKNALPPRMPAWRPNAALAENLQTFYAFGRAYISYIANVSGYEGKKVIEEMFGEEIAERRIHHWNTYQQMIMVDQVEQERLRGMNYVFKGMFFVTLLRLVCNRLTHSDVADLKGKGIPHAYKAFKEEHGDDYMRILANYAKEHRINPAMNPQIRRKEFESARHLIENFVSLFLRTSIIANSFRRMDSARPLGSTLQCSVPATLQ